MNTTLTLPLGVTSLTAAEISSIRGGWLGGEFTRALTTWLISNSNEIAHGIVEGWQAALDG